MAGLVVSGTQVSYIGQDCREIPEHLGRDCGHFAKRLDLSFNLLRSLKRERVGLEKVNPQRHSTVLTLIILVPQLESRACLSSASGMEAAQSNTADSVYKAFVMETFVHLCSLGSWTALLARAVVTTGLLALSTLALYVAIVSVHS
ncbi:hypothetical protein MUG91_G61n28 [Manis pentadactyla]|nr:hypothetical protein MUG91_G61n28 [Manis pentadactyla]